MVIEAGATFALRLAIQEMTVLGIQKFQSMILNWLFPGTMEGAGSQLNQLSGQQKLILVRKKIGFKTQPKTLLKESMESNNHLNLNTSSKRETLAITLMDDGEATRQATALFLVRARLLRTMDGGIPAVRTTIQVAVGLASIPRKTLLQLIVMMHSHDFRAKAMDFMD